MNAALIWDPAFTSYRFRPDHPFNPRRLELAVSLMEEMELLSAPGLRVVAPVQATEDDLLRVHSRDYIEAVKAFGQQGDAEPEAARRWGLGTEDNPVFPGMHEATSMVVGGTLRAAQMVMSGEVQRAFAIAGGLHHAHRDRASGFCVYSDLAVAIHWMREAHGARVMYIDFDAHHGDGVQGIFYGDSDVLTLSLHESGRYLFPGTGFVDELGDGDGYGYSLNVPMEPFTEDGSWMGIYADLLPEVAAAFRPDVIVLVAGCDSHVLDPLTHLRCSTRVCEETVRLTREIADQYCGGRMVVTGAGGYAIWRVVPRSWTLVWAELTEQRAPNQIPLSWQQRWQGEAPHVLPDRLRDQPDQYTAVPRRDEIEAMNRRTLESLRRSALPLLRGWSMGF